MKIFSILAFALPIVSAQLSGRVGPTTSYTAKAHTKTCNVLNYGAVADGKTDLGPALSSAWLACRSGGLVWIPSGTYAMATWVSLNSGSSAAIQLDGTIIRTGTAGSNITLSTAVTILKSLAAIPKVRCKATGSSSYPKANTVHASFV